MRIYIEELPFDLQEFYNLLMPWSKLGMKELSNGSVLLGDVPDNRPIRYVHTIFAGLSYEEIRSINLPMKKAMPADFVSFLKYFNGCHLFSGLLSIYGKRSNWSRIPGEQSWQPYDLFSENLSVLDRVIIGNYFYGDGYKLVMSDGGQVNLISLSDPLLPLFEWANISEMLIHEVKRLAGFFDNGGKRVDYTNPVIPLS